MHEQRRVTRPRSNNLILSLASIQRAKGSLGLSLARTAPHQSRKKRELTRAVELLKTKYGGGIEPHRLLSAPSAVLANVFTSLARS